MKIFVLALLLPFAACQDCPTLDPVTCNPPELYCWGGVDSKGCDLPDFCHFVDPYAPCSAFASCSVTCPEDMVVCPGGENSWNGCPYQETCMPAPSSDDPCPYTDPCPVNCRTDQIMCGGELYDGCPGPYWCMDQDPNCPYQSCPVDCPEGHSPCPGGVDWNGCPLPETCMDISLYGENGEEIEGNTLWMCDYPYCPTVCGNNQIMCMAERDENGCQSTWDWCLDIDYTTICPQACPTVCTPDMVPCYEGKDYNGCELPMSCHPTTDGCPTDSTTG